MFCSNCGSKVYDDSIYCSYCGFKLHREDNETHVQETGAVIRPESQIITTDNANKEAAPVTEPPTMTGGEQVVPVNIMVQPVPDTMPANEIPKQTEGIEGGNGTFFMPDEEQQQQIETTQEKKNIFAFSVISAVFAVLTIAASVFEMLDNVFVIEDTLRLIEISITAIILIAYAFTNYRTISVLKGIAVIIALVADIIFVGYSSIEYGIESLLSNNMIERLSARYVIEEWVVAAFFISLLLWFVIMYIFFIVDAIRGFMGTRKLKAVTLLLGFMAASAVVANIVFRSIIEGDVTLYYDIVPMNSVYAFLILSMCFGIIGKKKLKTEEQE